MARRQRAVKVLGIRVQSIGSNCHSTSSTQSISLTMPPPAMKYSVEISAEDLQGLTKVKLPGRNKQLPPIYRGSVTDHPLVPTLNLNQNLYIIFVDPSLAGKNRWKEIIKTLTIPYGWMALMRKKEPGTTTFCAHSV